MSHAEDQIEKLAKKLNSKMLVRKELKKLPGMLHESEQVLNLVQGEYEGHQGLIVATDRRVMFINEGMVRSDREDFPYERISSVQCSTGMISGKLILFASGNKAEIANVMPKQQANTLADLIRHRIAPGATEPPPAAAAPQQNGGAAAQPDVYDQLRKLGELRDAGVLTDEEFAAKKTLLLAEI